MSGSTSIDGALRWKRRLRPRVAVRGLPASAGLALVLLLAAASVVQAADAVDAPPLPPPSHSAAAAAGDAPPAFSQPSPQPLSPEPLATPWPDRRLRAGPLGSSAPSADGNSGPVFEPRFPGTTAPPSAESPPSGLEAPTGPRPPGFFGGESGQPSPWSIPQEQRWLAHPWSVGLFIGYLNGSTLIDNWTNQGSGMLAGLRMGCDVDDYWGLELRYAFGSCSISDSAQALQAAAAANVPVGNGRFADYALLDAEFLFYPWGEHRWRPYVLMGIGAAEVHFSDVMQLYSASVAGLPLALGVKYRCTDRLALRLELCDDVIFSGQTGFNNLNDFSLTGALELRFGGSRRSYWPWDPSHSAW